MIAAHELLLNAVQLLQVPVSLWLALYGAPATSFLLSRVSDTGVYTQEIRCGLTVSCVLVAVLLLYATVLARHQQQETRGACTHNFDTDDDSNPFYDVVFWGSSIAFAALRSFLLIDEVDVFAVMLLTLLWSLSVFTACRRVVHVNWLRIRLAAVATFMGSVVLTFALVSMGVETPTEVYVLALCVVADSILIVGHTWDYPDNSISTVLNCRLAYMCVLQLALPAAVAANIAIL
jgi:hypothetical protein